MTTPSLAGRTKRNRRSTTKKGFDPTNSEVLSIALMGTGLLGWLVSEHCNLKGTTLIVGANHARLVKTLETASIDLAEDPQAAAETLMQAPCGPRAAASASAEFEDFIRSLASARRR